VGGRGTTGSDRRPRRGWASRRGVLGEGQAGHGGGRQAANLVAAVGGGCGRGDRVRRVLLLKPGAHGGIECVAVGADEEAAQGAGARNGPRQFPDPSTSLVVVVFRELRRIQRRLSPSRG
jgi:hypothetical protein